MIDAAGVSSPPRQRLCASCVRNSGRNEHTSHPLYLKPSLVADQARGR